MKTPRKIGILAIIFVFCFLSSAIIARADDGLNFNPNFIISDEEILDDRAMSLDSIQKFLVSKNSYLADYSCPDAKGITRKASEIIYNAAVNNYDCDDAVNLSDNPTDLEKAEKCLKVTINPKFLLVLIQKEQSLLESSRAPSQSQLDWAAGYGCPDGSACGSRWKGFGKQINSAALQFFDYMRHPQYYTYKAGGYYMLTNPYSVGSKEPIAVSPMNQATAALYNYTPHVYNGNYNFYKIWQRWFTKFYPDGTLIQAKGEAGVWLIQGGKKRPFISRGALTSRYDPNKIISVNSSDLDKYEKGTPIKFSQYSLVRSPMGAIYLLVDDKKHVLVGKDTFKKIGFNPEEVSNASLDDINAYIDGSPITATSTYPTGALVQNNVTGGVYWLSDETKAPILDRIFLTTKFKHKRIIKMTPANLDKFPTVAPIVFNDGELLMSPGSSGVYIITNGQKRPFISGEIFEGLGYKWKNIISVSPKVLSIYPLGEAIMSLNMPSTNLNASSPTNPSTTTPAVSTSDPTSTVISTASSAIVSVVK